jgi:small conductance mechanosensitive channel
MTPTPTVSPDAILIPTVTTASPATISSDQLVAALVPVIEALIVLAVALIVGRYARFWVVRLFTRRRISLNVSALLGNLLQVLVVALGFIFALHFFVAWPELLTLVGAAGLAISLSLQDLLKNVIAGIYILMEQPFHIGDRIAVKEAIGVVQGIELRTTILCTDEGLQVVVPNSTILNEIVVNHSASDLQRQIITLSIKTGNLGETSEHISNLLRDFQDIAASPAPVTALEEVRDGIARLRLEFWVPAAQRVAVTSQVVQALKARFPDAGVAVV